MPRVQLALNVADIEDAIAFYSQVFRTEPVKQRPGYANFAIADPPLKLVLFENPGSHNPLNHLGVEVSSTDEVIAETRRLGAAGLETRTEEGTTCCYAEQDKVWVGAEGQQTWEIYTVLADAAPDLEGKTLADANQITQAANSSSQATCCA